MSELTTVAFLLITITILIGLKSWLNSKEREIHLFIEDEEYVWKTLIEGHERGAKLTIDLGNGDSDKTVMTITDTEGKAQIYLEDWVTYKIGERNALWPRWFEFGMLRTDQHDLIEVQEIKVFQSSHPDTIGKYPHKGTEMLLKLDLYDFPDFTAPKYREVIRSYYSGEEEINWTLCCWTYDRGLFIYKLRGVHQQREKDKTEDQIACAFTLLNPEDPEWFRLSVFFQKEKSTWKN